MLSLSDRLGDINYTTDMSALPNGVYFNVYDFVNGNYDSHNFFSYDTVATVISYYNGSFSGDVFMRLTPEGYFQIASPTRAYQMDDGTGQGSNGYGCAFLFEEGMGGPPPGGPILPPI